MRLIYLLALYLTLVSTSIAATPVRINVLSMTGSPEDRVVTIRPVYNPVRSGTNIYYLPPAGLVFSTVNGTAETNLVSNDYTVTLSGVSRSWRISVPDTNVTVNIAEIATTLPTYTYTNNIVWLTNAAGTAFSNITEDASAVTISTNLQVSGSTVHFTLDGSTLQMERSAPPEFSGYPVIASGSGAARIGFDDGYDQVHIGNSLLTVGPDAIYAGAAVDMGRNDLLNARRMTSGATIDGTMLDINPATGFRFEALTPLSGPTPTFVLTNAETLHGLEFSDIKLHWPPHGS